MRAAAAKADPEVQRELRDLAAAGLRYSDPMAYCEAYTRAFLLTRVADPKSLERMQSRPCVQPNVDPETSALLGRAITDRLRDWDWRSALGVLDVPVLVVHGDQDTYPLEGAAEYVEKPVDRHRLRQVVRDLLLSRVEERPRRMAQAVGYHGIIGDCDAMKRVFSRLQRVAPYDLPTLVQGESGTGKELVARALHKASERANAQYFISFSGASRWL